MNGIMQAIVNEEFENKEIVLQNSEVAKLQADLHIVKKEMEQFVYIVSHDLQAPLRMVTGFLELLEKKYSDKLDAGARQYISYATKGAVKMKALIFDLLELSRLNTTVLKMEPVDLTTMFYDIAAKLDIVVDESINIEKIPLVTVDPGKMEVLFFNLLSNAKKFKSDKPLKITVSGLQEEGFIKILIADNGIGIDAAFFEKIFIIFRRLHTDEEKYPGTGTGLALCKKIVELHGGAIGLESSPGLGSTFWVKLPANL